MDYFFHASNLRNNPRIQALRRKFGLIGYGVYLMVREYMAAGDGTFDVEGDWDYELYACEFDIEEETLRQILDFLLRVKVLDVNKRDDGHIIYSLNPDLA